MKETECPNCGAVFKAKEPKCPYCGYINPMGAEAKFLRDLEKTRKEMDMVDDEAKKAYGMEIKKGVKSTAKTVLIMGLIVLLIIGGLILLGKTVFNDAYKGSYKDELTWQHDRFIEYDAMLDSGEYEELMEAITVDGKSHEVWKWDRYDEFKEITDGLWEYSEYGAGDENGVSQN